MKTAEEKLTQALGLSEYQAKIYFAGLYFDQATITEIAKKANISRTAAYEPMEGLLGLGIMSVNKIGKRKYYSSIDPKNLAHIHEQRKMLLDESIADITQMIRSSKADISARYFPGVRGMQTAGDIFLDESKSKLWKTFEQPEYTLQFSGAKYTENYIKKRLKKKIFGRVIIPANVKSGFIKKHIAQDKQELRKTILVSAITYPLESSIAICDDMVLIIAAKKEPITLLIKNEEIAKSLSSIHDMIWDRYNM